MEPIKELEDCVLKVLREFSEETDAYADKMTQVRIALDNESLIPVSITNGDYAGKTGIVSSISETNPESSVVVDLDDTGESITVDINDLKLDPYDAGFEGKDWLDNQDEPGSDDENFTEDDDNTELGDDDIGLESVPGSLEADRNGNKHSTVKTNPDELDELEPVDESKKIEKKPHRNFRIKKCDDKCCQEDENKRKLTEAREFGFSIS